MKPGTKQALEDDPLLGLKWCQICDIIPPEGDENWCNCVPCPRCGKTGEPKCIKEHEHIPDPVSLTEAANATGINRDVIYKWVQRDWVNSFKLSKTVTTAPILVSLYEVRNFKPPKRGWQKGVKRCPGCGRALVAFHWCDELQKAGDIQTQFGKRLVELDQASLQDVIDKAGDRPILLEAAKVILVFREEFPHKRDALE